MAKRKLAVPVAHVAGLVGGILAVVGKDEKLPFVLRHAILVMRAEDRNARRHAGPEQRQHIAACIAAVANGTCGPAAAQHMLPAEIFFGHPVRFGVKYPPANMIHILLLQALLRRRLSAPARPRFFFLGVVIFGLIVGVGTLADKAGCNEAGVLIA